MTPGSASPATAVMNSFWLTARNAARRIAGLSNGGYRWLKRSTPIRPVVSITSTRRLRSDFSDGTRSMTGCSTQSTSPACKAAAWVAGSGVVSHSTRSKLRDAGAGAEAGDTLARQVFVELRVGVARAGDAFVRQEAERAAADHLGQQRGGRGLGQPFRHDRRHLVGRFRQRLRQQRERTIQPENDLLVGRGGQIVGGRHQRLAECVLRRPATQAGDHVAAENRRAVVEQQPVAQRQRPDLLIRVDGVTGQHLVLRRAGGIEREQRIEHHHHVVARHEGADQRIEQRQVGIRNELQRGGGGGSHNGWAGDAARQGRSRGTPNKLASFHAYRLR